MFALWVQVVLVCVVDFWSGMSATNGAELFGPLQKVFKNKKNLRKVVRKFFIFKTHSVLYYGGLVFFSGVTFLCSLHQLFNYPKGNCKRQQYKFKTKLVCVVVALKGFMHSFLLLTHLVFVFCVLKI